MHFNVIPQLLAFFSKYQSQRAFGLVELMVSISIMLLISTLILAKHNSFNGAVLLRNQAYEVAFALREAQLQAVSGIGAATGSVEQYGVYFNTSAATKNQYIIFRDDGTTPGRYDAGSDTQIGQVRRLDSRFEVKAITYNGTATGNMSVTFRRPNFDGLFRHSTSGYLTGPVIIDIARVGSTGTGSGDRRRVEISSAGQISVVTY